MALTDLRAFIDTPKLTLPIGGKSYVVEPATAATWIRLQDIHARASATDIKPDADVSELDNLSEMDLYKLALGATYDQLVDGGVTAAELKHAGMTAYYWQLGQDTVAEAVWNSAGKALTSTPRRRSTSTSTGAASTTRRRASTSGTSSRKK